MAIDCSYEERFRSRFTTGNEYEAIGICMSVQYSTGTELEHRVYGMAYVSIHNLLPVQ